MIDNSRRVYFARCIDPDGQPMSAYKIGCSHGPLDRVKQVTSNLPFSLQLIAVAPGDRVTEAACFLYLKEHIIRGEYVCANDAVERFINRVSNTGRAFPLFTDLGEWRLDNDLLDSFMQYHGITLPDACKRLGVPVKRFEEYKKRRNLKLIAAAILVALERGHIVNWPTNAAEGALGHRSRFVKSDSEAA